MRFPFPLAFLGEYNQSLDIVTANPLWKKQQQHITQPQEVLWWCC